ncbi:c2H2-type domain-containing protein [Caerostris extrusa]|uniref:C2H2-type domain-containing protein n=1 Tax=Caerostris extrusa TaxID=172846 RepID=A0AAV4QHX7_CAEEX|nr:c2H2-type domain-containing protein [Caerostris extrusa]
MKKPNLVLDKPIFIGFSVLELSKLQMFKLYYTHFKSYYGSKCELLYTDTDSLYMNIETKDVYQDLRRKFKSILDLSNFERDIPMFEDSNKGKLGLLKSETLQPIKEFIGLKCKMYAFSYGNNIKKTAKGVKKSNVSGFNLNMYKNVLYDKLCLKQKQAAIISKKHELKTIVQNKIGLSAYYDKNSFRLMV